MTQYVCKQKQNDVNKFVAFVLSRELKSVDPC